MRISWKYLAQCVVCAIIGVVGTHWTVKEVQASGIVQQAYNLVQNAGSPLTRRTTLNFSTGTTASDSGGVTTITAGGSSNQQIRSFGAGFDGGGSPLTAGKTVYTTVPFACTIAAWNITVDTGTATVDIWKIGTGTAIPTIANTITAAALPAISSGTAIHSTTLTGWTTSVSANDILGFNLNTVVTATELNIVVQCNATT